MGSFQKLGVADFLVDNLQSLKITTPTEIQSKTIPLILQGHNLIAQAETGSGKTAAFALPIMTKLSEDPYGGFALVLTPSRELAFQIEEQFRVFGRSSGLTEIVICGGQDKLREKTEMAKRPHILIATPGRLAAHFRDAVDCPADHLKFLRFLVLDEADRLLDESFWADVSAIIQRLPSFEKRVTLLFTATLDEKTRQLSEGRRQKVRLIETSAETPSNAKLFYLFVPRAVKECYLLALLTDHFDGKAAIVFVARRRVCELLTETLVQLGVDAVALHSNLNQARRSASLGKFRAHKARVLVCTDLAARGLDIPEVPLVVNFHVPLRASDFVHRIGRTARQRAQGVALTFVTQYETEVLARIESRIARRLELFGPMGGEEAVLRRLHRVSQAKKVARLRLAEWEAKSVSFSFYMEHR